MSSIFFWNSAFTHPTILCTISFLSASAWPTEDALWVMEEDILSPLMSLSPSFSQSVNSHEQLSPSLEQTCIWTARSEAPEACVAGVCQRIKTDVHSALELTDRIGMEDITSLCVCFFFPLFLPAFSMSLFGVARTRMNKTAKIIHKRERITHIRGCVITHQIFQT